MSGTDAAKLCSGVVVLSSAAVVSGCYLAWLLAFERIVDPYLRRAVGRVLGCTIVWMPAGGRFRVWGTPWEASRTKDASAALVGSAAVLVAAAMPAVLSSVAAGWIGHEPVKGNFGREPLIVATIHAMAVPMILVFVLRVLSGAARTA
jgi:hypothetical protein